MVRKGAEPLDRGSTESNGLVPGRFDQSLSRGSVPYPDQLLRGLAALSNAALSELRQEVHRIPPRRPDRRPSVVHPHDGGRAADALLRDLLPLLIDRDLFYVGHEGAKIPQDLPEQGKTHPAGILVEAVGEPDDVGKHMGLGRLPPHGHPVDPMQRGAPAAEDGARTGLLGKGVYGNDHVKAPVAAELAPVEYPLFLQSRHRILDRLEGPFPAAGVGLYHIAVRNPIPPFSGEMGRPHGHMERGIERERQVRILVRHRPGNPFLKRLDQLIPMSGRHRFGRPVDLPSLFPRDHQDDVPSLRGLEDVGGDVLTGVIRQGFFECWIRHGIADCGSQ